MAKFETTKQFVNGEIADAAALNAIIEQLAAGEDLPADGTLVEDSGGLKVGSITSSNLPEFVVTTEKLAAFAVTTGKIYAGAVTDVKIADGAVTTGKIQSLAVTFAKLAEALIASQQQMRDQTTGTLAAADQMVNHPGVAKASGAVTPEGTSLGTPYNCTSVSTGTSREVLVTFLRPMKDIYYSVVVSSDNGGSSTTSGDFSVVINKTTTNFTIRANDAQTAEILFAVFGELADE